MNARHLVTACVAAGALSLAPALDAADPAPAGGDAELRAQVSYLVGLQMSNTVQQYDLDAAIVAKALADASAGLPPTVDPSRGADLFPRWEAVMKAKQANAGAERGAANAAWLGANAAKKGVTTTASGIQYEVLKAVEKADKPTRDSTVRVHYTGTTIDGKMFDSSEKRGEPAEFPLTGVIAGWTEGVQLMKVGERFRFAIPPELAYGENAPPAIGPNQILIFEIELLAILK